MFANFSPFNCCDASIGTKSFLGGSERFPWPPKHNNNSNHWSLFYSNIWEKYLFCSNNQLTHHNNCDHIKSIHLQYFLHKWKKEKKQKHITKCNVWHNHFSLSCYYILDNSINDAHVIRPLYTKHIFMWMFQIIEFKNFYSKWI